MWAYHGTWTTRWGLGVPLAAIIVLIGMLLYSNAKGSTVLKYGIGIFLAVFAGMAKKILIFSFGLLILISPPLLLPQEKCFVSG